ncbi:PepSY domain-containing protein [Limnobacter litoralis]|uniref:Peptidase M4 n=1 Tax=Limnobacter litoralis TaxID=481366 RepID=A0ABQ5YPD4_9BURK|nr:PepSY domain-containing protein [Limnobacter litoralis]GLR25185.1 peptidase M4 [Limnobacter litoralis]
MKIRLIQIGILSTAVAALASVAYAAEQHEKNDALMYGVSAIPIKQAIVVAEDAAKGRATRAELEHSKNGVVYDIEVIDGTNVKDVRVDAKTGTVLFVKADEVDRQPENDPED